MSDLRAAAREQIRNIVGDQRKPLELAAVVDIGDVPPTDDSDKRRYELGIENIDRHMGPIRPGEFVIIGARQGEGKTSIGETCALQNAIRYRVMFATLEMRSEDIRDRLVARIMGTTLDEVERLRAFKDDFYLACCDTLASLNLKLYRPKNAVFRTSAAVLRAAESCRADVLIIDYTRSLTDWDVKQGTPSEIVARLSMWAKETRTTVVLLSQLHRDAQGKRPIESQLQDTGRLEQEGEKIVLLWRKFAGTELDDVCEVIVAKNRRGPKFRGHVRWHGPTMKFYPMTREEEAQAACCAESSR